MGNCTVTVRQDFSLGPFHAKIVDIAGSTSYATGGDALSLASLGLKSVQAIFLAGAYGPAALFHVLAPVSGTTPLTDLKLMARDTVTGAEVTAAQNLSTEIVRALVLGEGPFSN